MIVENGLYYLYRHIRLDTDEPFYIGVGTKDGKKIYSKYIKTVYKRAFSFNKRNTHWRRIVKKVGYKVEIMLESDNYEFILNKEIEFIALYGREDLGLGKLCNKTDGGEGTIGIIRSIESIKKVAELHSIKVYNKETGIIFNSIREAAESINISHQKLSTELSKQFSRCKFQYVNKGLIKPYQNKVSIQVINKSTGEIYKSINDCAKNNKISWDRLEVLLSDKNSNYERLDGKIYKKSDHKSKIKTLDIENNILYLSMKDAWESSDKLLSYTKFKYLLLVNKNLKYKRNNNDKIT